jgi:hypothetical protein
VNRILALWTVLAGAALAASTPAIFNESVPEVIGKEITRDDFRSVFQIDDRINPFYLTGDFDGDGKSDYAFLVVRRHENKRGFFVILSSTHTTQILGAGKAIKYGGGNSDDLNFNAWVPRRLKNIDLEDGGLSPQRKARQDGILVSKVESASGIYYWNGKSFRWIQQGD